MDGMERIAMKTIYATIAKILANTEVFDLEGYVNVIVNLITVEKIVKTTFEFWKTGGLEPLLTVGTTYPISHFKIQ